MPNNLLSLPGTVGTYTEVVPTGSMHTWAFVRDSVRCTKLAGWKVTKTFSAAYKVVHTVCIEIST